MFLTSALEKPPTEIDGTALNIEHIHVIVLTKKLHVQRLLMLKRTPASGFIPDPG